MDLRHVLLLSAYVFTICAQKQYGQGPYPPVDCSKEYCSLPLCRNPFIPYGKCCPVCPVVNKQCWYKGKRFESGDRFKDECNACWCNNGSVGCTKKACKCVYKGQVYQEGDNFNDDCNTCTCRSGSVSCSDRPCRQTCVYKGQVYNDGDHFKDQCNNCVCVNGSVSCSDMSCRQTCVYEGQVYNNGDHFKDQCNNCVCVNGSVSCSDMACPCVYKGITYSDGTTFKDVCNTCTCRNGVVGCTKMACPKPGQCPVAHGFGICVSLCNSDYSCIGTAKCCINGCGTVCTGPECVYNGQRYKEGDSFKDGCNTCTCRSGSVSCTEMACQCVYKGKVYKEGDSFKYGCNTCTCRSGSLSCTEMACPPVDPCAAVRCAELTCKYYHIPVGQCCPVCDSGCTYNGVFYEEGDSVKTNDPCDECKCQQGQVNCYQKSCKPVYCDESYTKPGDCCPSCPDNSSY